MRFSAPENAKMCERFYIKNNEKVKDKGFVCGVVMKEITVNGIKLSEIQKNKRQEDMEKTTPAKKMTPKRPMKKPSPVPSVKKEGTILKFLEKKT